MPMKSVGFVVGNLRARENRLLKQTELMSLLAAKNTDELAKMLTDKGIGNGDTNEVPTLLSEETEKLWSYITENAPDMSVFEPFLYENDFHNFKAVLKGIIRGRAYDDLLILPSLIDKKTLERSIKEKRFDLLPDYIKNTAADAYSVLAETGDSQMCDSIIDAGQMTAQLNKAKETHNDIIINIITVSVFYKNIKAALRAAKTNKSAAFLETALTETGVVSKRAMVTAALSGEEKLLELLNKAVKVGGVTAAQVYKKSAGEFEKFADDRIIKAAAKCKFVTIGTEPLIGYMLARKTEVKNLHIIYSGVKTGQPTEKTKERLRELYG